MKQRFSFFRNVAASFIGNALLFLVVTICFSGLVGILIERRSGKDKVDTKTIENSVLEITLQGVIREYSGKMAGSNTVSIEGISKALKRAADDDDIVAVLVKVKSPDADLATRGAIRDILEKFSSSTGKSIIAHSYFYDEETFMFFPKNTRFVIAPGGSVAIAGLVYNSMFYKPLLDKLQVHAITVRTGKNKTAIEPYIAEAPSQEFQAQLDKILGQAVGLMHQHMAAIRTVDAEQITRDLKEMPLLTPEDAKARGYIDSICAESFLEQVLRRMLFAAPEVHEDTLVAKEQDVLPTTEKEQAIPPVAETPSAVTAQAEKTTDEGTLLKKQLALAQDKPVSEAEGVQKRSSKQEKATTDGKVTTEAIPREDEDKKDKKGSMGDDESLSGLDSLPKLGRVIAYKKYLIAKPMPKSKYSEKILLLHMKGEVVSGHGQASEIGAETVIKRLKKIAKNKDIKAVVLIMDSPGGSAKASEDIADAILAFREKTGIPCLCHVRRKMLSGGTLISSACEEIRLQPESLAGSIGVFGLYFNIKDAIEQNLHINIFSTKTHPNADLWNEMSSPSPKQMEMMQTHIDHIYQCFIHRVATSRKLTEEAVRNIAGGRVWTAEEALAHGLVDGIGTLQESIERAQTLAELEEGMFEVVYYEPSIVLKEAIHRLLYEDLGENELEYAAYKISKEHLDLLKRRRGVQMLSPFQQVS
jgi:signal peptide peptidase SppA